MGLKHPPRTPSLGLFLVPLFLSPHPAARPALSPPVFCLHPSSCLFPLSQAASFCLSLIPWFILFFLSFSPPRPLSVSPSFSLSFVFSRSLFLSFSLSRLCSFFLSSFSSQSLSLLPWSLRVPRLPQVPGRSPPRRQRPPVARTWPSAMAHSPCRTGTAGAACSPTPAPRASTPTPWAAASARTTGTGPRSVPREAPSPPSRSAEVRGARTPGFSGRGVGAGV